MDRIHDASRTANIISQFIELIGGENSEENKLVNGFNCQPTRKSKGGRSKTLISNRWRRSRPMKKKLNSLRSLVPDITKMEEASITGSDEVVFLRELHKQAKNLKAETAALEASIARPESPDRGHQYRDTPEESNSVDNITCHQKIVMQLDIFQVEEEEFQIRLVCVEAARIAVTLYKALESLTGFTVQSSNLASTTSVDRCVFTFTIKVDVTDPKVSLASLKLHVTRAFFLEPRI